MYAHFLSLAFSPVKRMGPWFWPIHPGLLPGLFCRFFIFFVPFFLNFKHFINIHSDVEVWELFKMEGVLLMLFVKKTQWKICLICCKCGDIFTPAKDFSEGNICKFTCGFTWPFCLLAHLFFRGAGRILKLLCLV